MENITPPPSTTTANNDKLIIKESYMNSLDLSWSYAISQNNKTDNENNDNGYKDELLQYQDEIKQYLFQQFSENVIIIKDNEYDEKEEVQEKDVKSNNNGNNINSSGNGGDKESAKSRVLKYQKEIADPTLIQQSSALEKQLEQIVSSVTQLRQDVPSIIQTSVSQNIQNLSSLVLPPQLNTNNNNNNNNNNNITQTPTTINKRVPVKSTIQQQQQHVDDNSKETLNIDNNNNKKELENYHDSVLMVVNNVTENVDSTLTDSIEIKQKIDSTLEKSKQTIEVTRILFK